MAKRRYFPERGDAVWLMFTPQKGREQAGRCPAVVLSPKAYNRKVGLAIACPITSHAKGYPFEVQLPSKVKIEGVVLSDQIASIDWQERNAKFICKLPADCVGEVLAKVSTLFS